VPNLALKSSGQKLPIKSQAVVPQIIAAAGPNAQRRFVEYFTARIRNRNTREAYYRAVRYFCDWCAHCQIELDKIEPTLVAAYIEQLMRKRNARTGLPCAPASVKQHLAAIRMLFDYLVTGGVVPFNPASSVRGPKIVVEKGKTPVLSAVDTRRLFRSIDVSTIAGLRDRALIAIMVYAFARIGAVLKMNVGDLYENGRTLWLRLHEKRGSIIATMKTTQGASSGNLTVRVTDDLVVSAGSWHQTLDRHYRPVAHIEPPSVPMFAQVVEYLESQPLPRNEHVRLADEARTAAAVCVRVGSYFALLTDASLPFSPTAGDERTSHIDDAEMARMNVEISAAIAWWLNLKATDQKRYCRLVDRALVYLPLGRKTVGRSSHGDALWGCALKGFATEVKNAWPSERLMKDLGLAAKHPVRIIANSVTHVSWRNGPIENIHAGRGIGHAVNERRVLPRDEKAIIRQVQDGFYGALRGVESLVFDEAWPPPPDRVLPFMTPFMEPSRWSYTEQSRVIELPLRTDAAGEADPNDA